MLVAQIHNILEVLKTSSLEFSLKYFWMGSSPKEIRKRWGEKEKNNPSNHTSKKLPKNYQK